MYLKPTMRWFGPEDPVSLWDIRQAGCEGVVTALHHIPPGEIWTKKEIDIRIRMIEEAGMEWSVIESLPVHEDIKRRSGRHAEYIDNYIQSLRNISESGLTTVVYNFMPILDWLRTDISFPMPDKSRALRFEKSAFVAFDLFILKRPGAEKGYSAAEIGKAEQRFARMSGPEKETLYRNVLLGLPGTKEAFTEKQVLDALETYAPIDAGLLKQNLFAFLKAVVPVAEECGLRLAIHPDDPPFSVLGLPRIVSTEKDLEEILNAVDSPSNGLCFCTGSLGARADNNLTTMLNRFVSRVHFFHLRNTRRDEEGNFYEADHLEGDTDMYSIVKEAILHLQKTGRTVPLRPDHGHQMLDDLGKNTYPGYSAIGRLKGLAELRGLELGISRSLTEQVRPR